MPCYHPLHVTFCLVWDVQDQPRVLSYGLDSFSWIGRTWGFLMSFLIPTGLILFVNFLMFVCCAISLLLFHLKNNSFPPKSYMLFVFMKLLICSGAQWLLGVPDSLRTFIQK